MLYTSVSGAKDKATEGQMQLDEHDRLLREVAAINPDVFCVKQVRSDYAASHLRPELNKWVPFIDWSIYTDLSVSIVLSLYA